MIEENNNNVIHHLVENIDNILMKGPRRRLSVDSKSSASRSRIKNRSSLPVKNVPIRRTSHRNSNKNKRRYTGGENIKRSGNEPANQSYLKLKRIFFLRWMKKCAEKMSRNGPVEDCIDSDVDFSNTSPNSSEFLSRIERLKSQSRNYKFSDEVVHDMDSLSLSNLDMSISSPLPVERSSSLIESLSCSHIECVDS